MNNKEFSGRKILDLFSRFAYLAMIFLVPIYFAGPWFPTHNIFELNKLVVFKVFFWLLFLFTVVRIVFFPPPFHPQSAVSAFKRHGLLPAIWLVGLSFGLLFSLDPVQSFFGSYDRQAGLASYLLYFFWFLLLIFNLLVAGNPGREGVRARIEGALKVAAFSGFLVSIYGLLQIFNIDFLAWAEAPHLTRRTLSTLGQPNFLGSFLLFIIPLGIYFSLRAKKLFWRLAYSVFVLTALACLFFTASRGALLGLVLATLAFSLFFFRRLGWRRATVAIVGGLGVLIIFFLGWHYFSPSRLSDLNGQGSSSTGARLNFYRASLEAIAVRPLFGYGLENGGEVFLGRYVPQWGIPNGVGVATDRAHNIILDILISSGFWGLVFFALLYWYFARLVFSGMKKEATRDWSLFLGLGASAYLFSLLFNFSFVSGELYFWSFLAILAAAAISNSDFSGDNIEGVEEKKRRSIPPVKIFVLLLALGLSFWQIYLTGLSLAADHYFFYLLRNVDQGEIATAYVLRSYIKDDRPNPVSRDYYDGLWSEALSFYYPSLELRAAQAVASQELYRIKKELPDSGISNLLVKGKAATALGDYQAALNYFRRVGEGSPYWPPVYLEEGKAFFLAGDARSAVLAYRRALDCLPDIKGETLSARQLSAYNFYAYRINIGLADAYQKLGQKVLAEQYYQAALKFSGGK